jgi:hypothetical protein
MSRSVRGGPAEAGSFRSILSGFRADRLREVHETVNFAAIAKEPDDIARIVDAVDGGSLHHERCWRLR